MAISDNSDDPVRTAIERSLHAWARRDLEGALEPVSASVVHSLNLDTSLAPYVASAVGKDEVRRKLQMILDAFDFERFEIVALATEPSRGRADVEFRFRHKATGDVLQSRCRFMYRLREGKIVLIEEAHDARIVESFLRMVKSRGTAA